MEITSLEHHYIRVCAVSWINDVPRGLRSWADPPQLMQVVELPKPLPLPTSSGLYRIG